jgi:DNA-binding CsgD family transcriptional regulator
MAILDQRAGRIPEAAVLLRESLEIATQMGDPIYQLNCLDSCGHLCAATHRWAEAVTVWAARDAQSKDHGFTDIPQDEKRRQAPLQAARHALGLARTSEAEERGAVMTPATALEFAAMLAAARTPEPAAAGPLSARERELITLVAQGRTNAQIAAQLYISVRTVGSHLDRIRDKTGCRRRADLTRLALEAGLV